MKSFNVIIALCCGAILVSCTGKNNRFDASGSFEAVEVFVSSEANGRIIELNITEGQQLEKGQIVGHIDSTQLYLQKMSLLTNAKGVRAQQPNITTQTAAIVEQIATLDREYERTKKLIEANAATTKQLDDIRSQTEVLRRQLSAATSTLQKSSENISAQSSALEIQVAQLDDMLQKCIVASPVSGTVINKYVEAGELAGTGMPMFKVADLNDMFLRAYVTYDQMMKLKLNDNVTVFADDGNGGQRSYAGRVSWISDRAEFTPKTIQTKNERANQVYAIKVSVQNDGYLKIGMYGELKLGE